MMQTVVDNNCDMTVINITVIIITIVVTVVCVVRIRQTMIVGSKTRNMRCDKNKLSWTVIIRNDVRCCVC